MSTAFMEFHWTNRHQSTDADFCAASGTALLVVDYEAAQDDLLRFSRSGAEMQLEALEIAKVFAAELIEDRPSQILCVEPQLVVQVQQS